MTPRGSTLTISETKLHPQLQAFNRFFPWSTVLGLWSIVSFFVGKIDHFRVGNRADVRVLTLNRSTCVFEKPKQAVAGSWDLNDHKNRCTQNRTRTNVAKILQLKLNFVMI